jgi:glycosyltransferase involved in cell wall biosynthesis
MSTGVRIIGSVLVRNEDVFLEQAIRNVAAFCDRIHVLDHLSTDGTPEVLARLAREVDHLEVERSGDSSASHAQLQPYVGSRTWVLGVDGDELYDPAGLAPLREELLAGRFGDLFFVKAHVLNCDELDRDAGRARGFMAPPSRPVTKLFNLAAVESWNRCPQRLYGEAPAFRPGYGMDRTIDLGDTSEWSDDPLRLLHGCFLRRSSTDGSAFADGRLSLAEQASFRRGVGERVARLVRRRSVDRRMQRLQSEGRNWKQEWYRRGERVEVDATPFFSAV